MKLEKVVFLIATLTLLSVSGCDRAPQARSSPPQTDTLQRIIDRGEMRVGYLVWAPCVQRDERTGDLSGIYPDMVREIAKGLNVKTTWHETTLANFAAGLKSGQFDFCVGATFITIPRAAAVAFTQPVTYVGNSGVVRTDGGFRPTSIKDLGKPGLKIAVLQGQALEEYCQRHLPEAELLAIAGGDLTAPLVAVTSGRADIGLMNTVTVAAYAKEHPEVTPVLMGGKQVEMLPLAWSVRATDDGLLRFLDASITYLKATGRLEQYQEKYEVQLLYDTPRLHAAGQDSE